MTQSKHSLENVYFYEQETSLCFVVAKKRCPLKPSSSEVTNPQMCIMLTGKKLVYFSSGHFFITDFCRAAPV